jgi:hypothetical protein
MLAAWPMVCGQRVAEKTRVLDFAEAKLTVLVPGKEWKTELVGLSPQYCAKLSSLVTAKVGFILFVTPDECSQGADPVLKAHS